MAPVGQPSRHCRHDPQPSATPELGFSGAIGASVTTAPSTTRLPTPGTRMFEFLPHQPMAAR